MTLFARADVIDTVWATAADGNWRLRRTLVDKLSFQPEEIQAALDFLLKYGFAQSSKLGEEAFRMIKEGPSPMEAAKVLRALQCR
jgi:hypothetical protein